MNLPIKILKTVKLETQNIEITIDNIDDLVAAWDAWAGVTSRHLVCITNCRTIEVANSVTQFLRFNGDIINNYSYQRLSGVDAAPDAGRTDGADAINLPPIPGAANADAWGGSLFLIPHAFNTVNHKTVLALGGSAEFTIEAVAGRWAQPDAITSETIIEGVGDEMMVGSSLSIGVIDERYLVEEIETGVGLATFDNIPQGEGDLAVIASARGSQGAVDDVIYHSINDDGVAGNYPAQELIGRDGGPPTAAPVNQECGIITADNATALAFGAFVEVWSQYTKGNQPHFLSLSGYHETTGPTGEVRAMSGRRSNIEPINKLSFQPSNGTFLAGSLFSLYRVPKRIIERRELTEDTPLVTFEDISSNFEALLLHFYARTDVAAVADSIDIAFDTDVVAANYDMQELDGSGAAVTALRSLASPSWMGVPGNNEGAGEYYGGSILLLGHNDTDKHKHAIVLSGRGENSAFIRSCRFESRNWIEVAPQLNAQTQIRGLAVYNGRLYGSTAVLGRLFEWNGVNAWVQVAPQLGGEIYILSLAVYNGRLYGSTGAHGRLFEWNGVNAWVEVAPQLGAELYVYGLVVYNGQLYSGTAPNGLLYEWNGVNAWVEVAGQLNAQAQILNLVVHNGKLYGNSNPDGLLFEWNGVNAWVQVAPQLGGEGSRGLVVYNGRIYMGTNPGGLLYEWNGVDAWVQVAPQLGAETSIQSLGVYNGQLYSGTAPNGLLYEFNGVDAWVEVAPQLAAETTIYDLVVYNGRLYGGTGATGLLFSWGVIRRIDLTPTTGPNFLAGTIVELEGILRKEGLPPSEGGQWGV